MHVRYGEQTETIPACAGAAKVVKTWIWAEGIDYDPKIKFLKYGTADYLNSEDSYVNFHEERENHPGWTQKFLPGGYGINLEWGKGHHYDFGVTVAGVGLSAQSDYTTSTSQSYNTGNSGRDKHWTWGLNGNPLYGNSPQIIFSYTCTPGGDC